MKQIQRVDTTIELIITAFWLMIPAYLPNPFAAVFGGGKPIDGGRTLKDGRRIIGDGKTYRGLFSGIFFGVLAGSIQIWLTSRGFAILGIEMPAFGMDLLSAFKVVFALACGSLFGDMFKSFFKRRMGLKRGAPLPLVDQLDFVIGAWAFAYLAAPEWFVNNFTTGIMLTVLITTPLLHLTTNIIGYLAGIKKEPW
jgi:CDP-2,3-bis-(O-geranylgeranyl)-sn-glycerol synthase